MMDIFTIVGTLVALSLLMVIIPLCPLSAICWPLCTCQIPLVLMFISTIGAMTSYWLYQSSTGTSSLFSGAGLVPSMSSMQY
ncbi:hypothetical protein MIR68_012375 [Amoeboaphelidium protococcarum]|nr:hypothetical protein MIR68_012375 [Amoeboaphelidium protococcarum]KAI3646067.1 hypothetical protein MP228_008995 [Amoeboaphelidium protococcarum]